MELNLEKIMRDIRILSIGILKLIRSKEDGCIMGWRILGALGTVYVRYLKEKKVPLNVALDSVRDTYKRIK